MLEVVKTTTEKGKIRIEVRHPLLICHSGPGYWVVTAREYDTEQEAAEDRDSLRAETYQLLESGVRPPRR